VRGEARTARGERDNNIKSGARLSKHTNREERPTDRPDDGVDGVPGGIDPRNFIGKKFEAVEGAGDPENERITEHGKRLVGWSEHDPVLVNRKTGQKNRQVKIHPREAREAERDTKQLQLVHEQTMRVARPKSRAFHSFGFAVSERR
jgi:hypothetical protein